MTTLHPIFYFSQHLYINDHYITVSAMLAFKLFVSYHAYSA